MVIPHIKAGFLGITHPSAARHPIQILEESMLSVSARLACVRPAASVSIWAMIKLFNLRFLWLNEYWLQNYVFTEMACNSKSYYHSNRMVMNWYCRITTVVKRIGHSVHWKSICYRSNCCATLSERTNNVLIFINECPHRLIGLNC